MNFFKSLAGVVVENKGEGNVSTSKGRMAFIALLAGAMYIWIHSYLKHGAPVEISEYHFWMLSALLVYNFGKKTPYMKGGTKKLQDPEPVTSLPSSDDE